MDGWNEMNQKTEKKNYRLKNLTELIVIGGSHRSNEQTKRKERGQRDESQFYKYIHTPIYLCIYSLSLSIYIYIYLYIKHLGMDFKSCRLPCISQRSLHLSFSGSLDSGINFLHL